jgi:hypothetical protein
MQKQRCSIEEILSDLTRRPSFEEAMSFSNQEILNAGEKIGYDTPGDILKQILSVHDSAMPIVKQAVSYVLTENEKNNPDYYCFARDCDLLHDALQGTGIVHGNGLDKRIHYLKTSMGMENPNKKYFEEIGLSSNRFKKGPPFVFIDSGFIGTLFHEVGKWVGYNKDLPSKFMKGYLVSSGSRSCFDEIKLDNLTPSIIHDFDSNMKNSPYNNHRDLFLSNSFVAYMQLMPKFTGRYTQTLQKNGIWDVVPEKYKNLSKLKLFKRGINSSLPAAWDKQKNSIESRPYWINDDIVNPVASLILQKRTLEYFTDSLIQEKIHEEVVDDQETGKGFFKIIKSLMFR